MNPRDSSISPPLDALENAHLLRSRRGSHVDRPIYTQNLFDKSLELREGPLTPWQKARRWVRQAVIRVKDWHPSVITTCIHFVCAMFPILRWLPQYRLKEYLPRDLITGFTVGILQIPQGLAYALLAHVPAVVGLYTSFYPPLIYTLMCTSKHVSLGTFAITSIMTGKIIAGYEQAWALSGNSTRVTSNVSANSSDVSSLFGDGSSDPRTGLMVAITVAVGMWQLLMGVFGLGYFSVYLSDQLVKGFTTGAAFHVFTSQLISVLGLRNLKERSGPLKLPYTYMDIFKGIGLTNIPAVIVSTICIVSLLLAKFLFNNNEYVQSRLPFRFPIPGELLVVVFGSLASHLMNLRGPLYNVSVVGVIPMGLPPPKVPDAAVFTSILADSFTIAIVSFAVTLSLGKLYANKNGYAINANQELRAMGSANLFGGFFLCIPSTGSLGRTAVQTSMGGKTQVITLVSCMMVLVVILGIAFLLEPLPKACLASIIIVALSGLLGQVSELPQLWRISAIDTSVFVVSLLAVVLLDVDSGLGVSIAWCLLTVVFRTQRPDVAILGRAVYDIYKRTDVYKSAAEIPGLKIIRFESALYFANTDYFSKRVKLLCGIHPAQEPSPSKDRSKRARLRSVDFGHDNMGTMDMVAVGVVSDAASLAQLRASPTDVVGDPASIHHVILDCSSMNFVDVNGIKAVKSLAKDCREFDITLFLANCKANVRESFALSGYAEELSADNFFVTIQDGVMQVLRMQSDIEKRGSLNATTSSVPT